MSPYVRHMVGSVFRSVGRVSLFSKMSEHLLFLNIINVEERCRAIFRNNQLPFCASNSCCLLLLQGGKQFSQPNSQHLCQSTKTAIRMAHKHRISGTQEYLHQRYCDLFLQRISKLGLISRLAIDFEFQSKIVRNRSLPVARNRYPLPGYRNGVPCFPNGVPCFHNGISGFQKICPSIWILVLKTFLWISGHFQVEIFLKTWCVSE